MMVKENLALKATLRKQIVRLSCSIKQMQLDAEAGEMADTREKERQLRQTTEYYYKTFGLDF